MSSPQMYFGQYILFLINALTYTPFFCSSMIPFNTQKPLSRITIIPKLKIGKNKQSNNPTVAPRSSNCCCPRSQGQSLSSTISIPHIISHNPTQTTTHHMIFIPKRPWLSGNEHESWTCEFVCPDTHRLIQTIHISRAKMCVHVVPTHLHHLPNLPKLVQVSWRLRICELKCAQNVCKSIPPHIDTETERCVFKCTDQR